MEDAFVVGADLFRARFDGHEAAGDGAAGRAGDFDSLAAQSAEEFGRGGIFGHAERKRLELLGERSGGVVVDAGDAAAAFVEHGERLQDVVELRRGEVDGDALVAVDGCRRVRSSRHRFCRARPCGRANPLTTCGGGQLAPSATCGAADCAFGTGEASVVWSCEIVQR